MPCRSLLVLLLVLAAVPSSAAARGLEVGFIDDVLSEAPASSAPWLRRATDLNASVVRVGGGWRSIAPQRPARETDPADPAYRWGGIDQGVVNATAAGLRPFVSLTDAPDWAEARGRPANVRPGTWRPDAAAYGRFAQALARRYDGTFPDPGRPGATLPRVAAFQLWNEPNLERYLAPQWTRRGSGFVNTGADLYRDLLNAFYDGVKAAQPTATVVSGGTAPFGDPQPGGTRTMPVRFLRNVLCVSAKLRRSCAQKTRFDAFAHHPYSVGGPSRKALNADDVSIPDAGKLTRVVRAAVRLGTVLPKRSKALWITEISWDSSPPDPDGVPAATQARWLQESMASLWRQGASVVTWFRIRDQNVGAGYESTSQSGVYRDDGRAKPSAQAFAFPLAVTRRTAKTARLWMRLPATGTVVVERRVRGRWVAAVRFSAARSAVVQRSVRRAGATAFRARQGGATTRAASVR